MSSVYVMEPQTKGKVILTTSYGPIDIELWPKEAPKAVRNFVQLCLEGYYDDTIFHRIIKSFVVQGGDPTGTGEGGESIYGSVFADEFHSRLKFRHRGLVACAGPNKPDSNGSQFFITLDRCDWLDKKHTIFGKVTGNSIYNLLDLSEVEIGKDDRPRDPPPKIISVEVLWNPFDDIIPRILVCDAPTSEKQETTQKVNKKLNLLSYGEEADEDEEEIAAVEARKMQKTKDIVSTVRKALGPKKSETGFSESLDYGADDDEDSFDARMRQQILRKRIELGDLPPNKDLTKNQVESPPKPIVDHHDERPKKDKLFLKRKGIGSVAKADRLADTVADILLLGDVEERQLQKQEKRRRQAQENEMLATLEKFRSQVFSTKSEGRRDAPAGIKDDDDISDWMENMLKFALEHGRNNMCRSDDPNDYVVHDPLWEKGKEKFNKMQAKEKRRQREWAGRPLT